MKRLQIYIEEEIDEEEIDDALAAQALQQHTSKAALIRKFVAERLGRGVAMEDPLDALVGEFDEDPGDIDSLVYDEVRR